VLTTGAAADRGVATYLRKHPPEGEPVASYTTTAAKGSDPLAVVKSYIPGDVLTGYVPVSALVYAANNSFLEIIVQACFCVITIVAVAVQLKQKLANSGVPRSWRQVPRLPMVLSMLSFLAFSASLSASAFGLIPHYQPLYGTVAVLVFGVLLTVLAPVLEK
jgi:hypothetical protein